MNNKTQQNPTVPTRARMKPSIDRFVEALRQTRGNLTKTAEIFGVNRTTVHDWTKSDPAFAVAVKDSRGRMLDECITVSRIVALGIPEKDPSGKIIGWKVPPDSGMLRYLLGTLGRGEGFGENIDVTTNGQTIPANEMTREEIMAEIERIRSIRNDK